MFANLESGGLVGKRMDIGRPMMDIGRGLQVLEITGSDKPNVHLMSTLKKGGHG